MHSYTVASRLLAVENLDFANKHNCYNSYCTNCKHQELVFLLPNHSCCASGSDVSYAKFLSVYVH